jgi:hypothetical protein
MRRIAMPISYQEQAQLVCPACGADFAASVWLILDAQEEPQAVAALLNGELNLVACPACGQRGPAGAPLLFHDAAARRVIFAGAPGSAEHEIRDQARDLHALLVGSIPEEQRRPYLVDVDIAQDLDGVAHLLRRMQKRRPVSAPPPQPSEARPTPPPTDEPPPLLVAVEALLSADSPAELDRALADHPILLDPATDATLARLVEVAVEQREPAVADSLRQARTLLLRMSAAVSAPAPASAEAASPETALQALLAVTTASELEAVVAAHALLLRPDADRLLAERIELALDEGNERLAQALEDRREALAEYRKAAAAPAAHEPTLDEAIEALLTAEGEDALADVIDRYPVLLEAVAGQALWQFAAEARASGDEELATYAIECRELLRRVREGIR